MQAVETENYKLVKIESKAEAVKYGRTQWCTGRPDATYYESTYASGTLVAFFRKDKKRPQYQLFVHPTMSSVEFRDGGNLRAELKPVLEDVGGLDLVRELFSDREVRVLESFMEPVQKPAAQHQIPPVWQGTNFDAVPRSIDLGFGYGGEVTANIRSAAMDFVANEGELPTTGVPGQMCFLASSNQLMVFYGDRWVPVGNVQQTTRMSSQVEYSASMLDSRFGDFPTPVRMQPDEFEVTVTDCNRAGLRAMRDVMESSMLPLLNGGG